MNGMMDISRIRGPSARRSYQRLGRSTMDATLRADRHVVLGANPDTCVSLWSIRWVLVSITNDGMLRRWPDIDSNSGYTLTRQGKLREVNER
jgi:hypothetical protein